MDLYARLGVKRGASDAEIKKAYRRRAKDLHPDRNQNDPKAQDRFAELNGAYEILGDEAKRKQFDRGEIDAEGKPNSRASKAWVPGWEPGAAAGQVASSSISARAVRPSAVAGRSPASTRPTSSARSSATP